MSKPDKSIDPRILAAATEEFLSCGYEKASTNVICKNAGVTGGALYKRYSGKDELFSALVRPVADEFKAMLKGEQADFHGLPDREKETKALGPGLIATDFVDYVYDHFDSFKLLVVCSQGSSQGNFLDDVLEIVVTSTMKFIQETGHTAVIQGKEVPRKTIEILIGSYLAGIFAPVTQTMSREEAMVYAGHLQYFFNLGWADILQIKK